MQKAPTSNYEADRLAALARTRLLDTGEEVFFTELAELAAALLNAPIALVSFVDASKEWVKASTGLNLRHLPRERGFCTLALASPSPLVIADASADSRFNQSAGFGETQAVGALLAAPITVEERFQIGAVCVTDSQKRAWSEAEIANLVRLAHLAEQHIRARRAQIEEGRWRYLADALQIAERRSDALMELVQEGIVVQARSGAIVAANTAAGEILGLTHDQVIGRRSIDPRWRAIRADGGDFPGEEHPAMVALNTGVNQRGVSKGVETPGGERRWISIDAAGVRGTSDGPVDEAVVVFRQMKR